MNILELVNNSLQKDELHDLKKSLTKKYYAIKKQISVREAAIREMKDTDEIDLPTVVMDSEDRLQAAIISKDDDVSELWSAFNEYNSIKDLKELENAQIDAYEKEVKELKLLLESFPTIGEIKSLTLNK